MAMRAPVVVIAVRQVHAAVATHIDRLQLVRAVIQLEMLVNKSHVIHDSVPIGPLMAQQLLNIQSLLNSNTLRCLECCLKIFPLLKLLKNLKC